MIVGIPRETHRNEFRVGLTPFGVARLKSLGCEIVVEHDAGASERDRMLDRRLRRLFSPRDREWIPLLERVL